VLLSILDGDAVVPNLFVGEHNMISKRNLGKLALAGFWAVAITGIIATAFAEQPKKPGQHFSFAHKRPTFVEEGVTPEVVVSAVDSEGTLSVTDEIWSPTFAVPPHYHKTHGEAFYILSGQVEWTVGGETHVLGRGDCVQIPAYTVHSVKVVGGTDLHTLMIYQPGGFEAQMNFRARFTPQQQKDPRIAKMLKDMEDVNEVKPGDPPLPKMPVKYFSFAKTRLSYKDSGISSVAVSSADSGGRLDLQDEVWEENFAIGPHFHKLHAEMFYVIEGRVEWTVGGETHILTPGDSVYIPANTVHSAKALDGKALHTLLLYEPKGYDEHLQRQDSYSEQELKDPEVKELLRTLGDFNPVGDQ
jgi:quercetin dioxygenase-like cupin family protein